MFHSEKIVAQQQYSSRTSSILEVATCADAATAAAPRCSSSVATRIAAVWGSSSSAAVSSMYLYTGGTLQNRHWPQCSKNYVLQCVALRGAPPGSAMGQRRCAALCGVAHRWRGARTNCAELIELYRLLLQLSDRFRCVRMHRDNFFLFFQND